MPERHNISQPLCAPRSPHAQGRLDSLHIRLRAAATDESGAVAVLVAILLVVLLGVAALVIDLGGLYDRDRELQTAADAAALAGAQELIYTGRSGPAAKAEAEAYIDKNAAVSSLDVANLGRRDVVVGPSGSLPSWVDVDLREDDVPFYFALGRDTGSVTAHARAEIKAIVGVKSLFPVTAQYYVHRLFVKLRKSGEPTLSYELNEGAVSGGYSTWHVTFPANMATGYWDASLEAVDNDDDNVYARYLDIGRLNVLAVAVPPESTPPYVSSLSRSSDGSIVTVEVASGLPLDDPPIPPKLGVSIGGGGSTPGADTGRLSTEGLKLWSWNLGGNKVNFCSSVRDYEVQQLSLSIGQGGGAVSLPDVARFPDFHRDDGAYDVPIVSFSMPPSVVQGNNNMVTVEARVRTFQFGEYFPLKIVSNIQVHGGGSRRTANVFRDVQFVDELAGQFATGAQTWVPYWPPLKIDGKLDTAAEQVQGVSGGLINNGWQARVTLATAAGWDPTEYLTESDITGATSLQIPPFDPHFIVVPIVYWRNDDGPEVINYDSQITGSVSLTKNDYRIAMFAGYYVIDPPSPSDSAIGGYFIRAAAEGEWDPDYTPNPGDLFLETAVLTQ